jgi:hypothetical protein
MTHFFENPEYVINEQKSTGLGTNTMDSNILKMDSFCLGDMKLQNYDAVAIDMTHINETYEMLEMDQIDGVLGGDILMDFKAKIDYRSMVLTLSFAKAKYFKIK